MISQMFWRSHNLNNARIERISVSSSPSLLAQWKQSKRYMLLAATTVSDGGLVDALLVATATATHQSVSACAFPNRR